MGNVLVTEVTESRKDRVRCRLSESALAVCLDEVCKLFDPVEVLKLAVAARDLLKELKQTACADTARCALSAGLVDRELQEELCDIDHACVFIHDDESAGTHHRAYGYQVVIVHRCVYESCRNASA